MQYHFSKKWEKEVRIVAPREDGALYIVEGVSSGIQYVRGRRFLKLHPNPHFSEREDLLPDAVDQEPPSQKEGRRIQPPRAAKQKTSIRPTWSSICLLYTSDAADE